MFQSLRFRLFVIILAPLVVLALAIGAWRITVAQSTAQELYDRNLMFTAIAVARDVSRSDGDAILPETEQLLNQTAGGPVRYHVFGPDGVLVTGYAVPPIAPGQLEQGEAFAYYDATYRGNPARILRLKDETSIDGLSGTFTITVWQDIAVRNAFVWSLGLRALAVMAMLLAAVAGLIWFGVRIGLKPLTDLEEAISSRSPEDLRPIQRQIPVEAEGIVSQLNGLLERMRVTFEAQTAFVSDAAHQLRNPIAGLRALSESIRTAGTLEVAQSRAGELVTAATHAGDLANRLLTLERARAETGPEGVAPAQLGNLIRETVGHLEDEAAARNVQLRVNAEDCPPAHVDSVMIREALTNLIDNALVHGGTSLSTIDVFLRNTGDALEITVENDGACVAASDIPNILSRFGQIQPGAGSGLGLSIAEAVARRHGGALEVHPKDVGFSVSITLPLNPYRPTA
jgi:two-component system sensor histidine kinase TctE